jgi:hypothetical protein
MGFELVPPRRAGRKRCLKELEKCGQVFDWSLLSTTAFKPLIFSGFFVDDWREIEPGAGGKAIVTTTAKFPEPIPCCDNSIFMVLKRNKSEEYKHISNP